MVMTLLWLGWLCALLAVILANPCVVSCSITYLLYAVWLVKFLFYWLRCLWGRQVFVFDMQTMGQV